MYWQPAQEPGCLSASQDGSPPGSLFLRATWSTLVGLAHGTGPLLSTLWELQRATRLLPLNDSFEGSRDPRSRGSEGSGDLGYRDLGPLRCGERQRATQMLPLNDSF